MAGILANSASKTMVAADTSADNNVSGYTTGEQVTLSASPTGSSYAWGLAIPQGSTAARSRLSDATAASPTFTPDVAGYYVATCTVDGAFYVLRLSVTQSAISTTIEALRLQPKADADVRAPSTGAALYWSSTQGALVIKTSNGTVHTITTN